MRQILNRWWRRGPTARPTWRPLREAPGHWRQFVRWRAARIYLNWTGPWFEAYHYRRAGLPAPWPVEPLAPPEGGPPRGVALLYDARIGPRNFGYLFTLLRERVIALGYRVAHADQHPCPAALHPADVVEKVVLHPLPDPTHGAHPLDQRFGQVTVDLVRRDRQPLLLRLLAAPLPETCGFSKAPPFDELLRRVLGCDAQ